MFLSGNRELFAAAGDAVAPIVAVMTLAALISTLHSVRIQREELQLQREELEETRKVLQQQQAEMKAQAEALRSEMSASLSRNVLDALDATLRAAELRSANVQRLRERMPPDSQEGSRLREQDERFFKETLRGLKSLERVATAEFNRALRNRQQHLADDSPTPEIRVGRYGVFTAGDDA